jgi:hypothetical protein
LTQRSLQRVAAVALVAVFAVAAPARAATPQALLAKFQPVTVLHPAELFPPVAVDPFLAGAQLQQRLPDGTWRPVEPRPTALPTTDPSGCTTTNSAACWRLDLPGCTPAVGVASLACYSGLGQPSSSVVYGAVLRTANRIALQYWYWYAYDLWSGAFPPDDFVWQAHEGDWEVVTVLLTRAGRPVLAGYSQHSCGKRRAWSKVPKWGRTSHPVVYVALGSHANYFTATVQEIDLRPQCYLALGASILRHYLPAGVLEYTARGQRFGPRLRGVTRSRIVAVTAAAPQWMAFPGDWGEANYFHAPDPIGTRVAGRAPAGPRFHDLWTDPVGTVLRWPRG